MGKGEALMLAVTDAAAIAGTLLVLVGIIVGWLGGRGYQRYWDRRETRDKQLDANVAARYLKHEYDSLLVDYDIPAGTFGDPGKRLKPTPHDWGEYEPLVIDDLNTGVITDESKQRISDWYWQRTKGDHDG